MRYVFGTLALVAAIVIVGYSATTLFVAAFNASAEPWQQMLNGTGAAAIVVWEATAVLLIGLCWHRGYRPVAVIAVVALIAAMGATLSWEGRAVIGGQADKFATREVEVDRMAGQKTDLAFLRKRQELVALKPPSALVTKELEWIRNRIDQIEKDRGSSHAVNEVLPQAAWAARVFGGGEQLWRDVFLAIPLLFWMIARIVAVPLAVAGMTGSVKKPQEARTAPKAEAAPEVGEKSALAIYDAMKARGVASGKHTEYDLKTGLWHHVEFGPDKASEKPAEDPRDPPPSGGKPDPLKERTDLTRKAEAPAPVQAEPIKQPAARLVVDNDATKLSKRQAKKKKERRGEGAVIRWLDDCSSQTPDKRVKATSQDCRKSYIAWCEINNLHPVGHKAMSRVMSVELRKSDAGERGPRNRKGAVWPGLLIHTPSAEPLKRRA
jgi:hypothetical protein